VINPHRLMHNSSTIQLLTNTLTSIFNYNAMRYCLASIMLSTDASLAEKELDNVIEVSSSSSCDTCNMWDNDLWGDM